MSIDVSAIESLEKKTPLFAEHVALGGKMVPFAGFSMPVQYSGIRVEHDAVRQKLGLFDVSHMGNIFVQGKAALSFLQMLTVNNVEKLLPFNVQYSAFCYSNGTVLDDILVYNLGNNTYHIVVNASNISKAWAWLNEHLLPEVSLHNASEELGILSLQGPFSEQVAQKICALNLSDVKYYSAFRTEVNGVNMLVSRTGYTGEDGFEFFPENVDARNLWKKLIELGSEYGILPIGLGARDTLRLEAGYSLYGHELSDQTNLLEAGLSWITDLNKSDFIGKASLVQKKASGLQQKIVGLELLEKGIPREGCDVEYQGVKVGQLTSGTMSPTLIKGIGLAYLQSNLTVIGQEVNVVIREQRKKAKVVSRYFYRRKK